jgi:RHS repeat-associated protein
VKDCGWVDGLTVGTTSIVGQPDDLSEALDSNLKFTTTGASNWHVASGQSNEFYYDGDSAQSGTTSSGEESCLQTIVDSDNAETIKFYWKVSCQADVDYLEFYIDDVRQDPRLTGETDWALQSYSLSAGIHTLKWRFINGGGSSGQECGWVDYVQWTGPSPKQDPSKWQQIVYKQDVTGRRVEKQVDGYSTRYVYDGGQVIAEYDGNNNLLHKYIYGPGIDQPVSMIDVADSKTYYYHYDALGSVVALSDGSGSTVETYEYSVYGQVAASDANNPNPYMFAGRRYDIEIGLYYNRARYYNPYTGRFLQTDPVGYGDGMNWYAYCRNNPTNYADPSGALSWDMKAITEGGGAGNLIRFTIYADGGSEIRHYDANGVDDGLRWLCDQDDIFTDAWLGEQVGIKMAGDELTWWYLQAINKLGGGFDLKALENAGFHIVRQEAHLKMSETGLNPWTRTIHWSAKGFKLPWWIGSLPWQTMRDGPVTYLAHELQHAADQLSGANMFGDTENPDTDAWWSQLNAIRTQNIVAMNLIDLAPKAYKIGTWKVWPFTKWKKEDYLRDGGWDIGEPAPTPPWAK